MFCQNCGKPIDEKAAFCPCCGKPTGKPNIKNNNKVAKGISCALILLSFYAIFADDFSNVDEGNTGFAAYIILFLLIGSAFILYKTRVYLINIICFGGLSIIYLLKLIGLTELFNLFNKYLDFDAFKFLYWMYFIPLIIITIILISKYNKTKKASDKLKGPRLQTKEKIKFTNDYLSSSSSPEQINNTFDKKLLYIGIFAISINLLQIIRYIVTTFRFVVPTLNPSSMNGQEIIINRVLFSLFPSICSSILLYMLISILKMKSNSSIINKEKRKFHILSIIVLIISLLGFFLTITIIPAILSSSILTLIINLVPVAVVYLLVTKRITPFAAKYCLLPLLTICIIALSLEFTLNTFFTIKSIIRVHNISGYSMDLTFIINIVINSIMLGDAVMIIFFGKILNNLLSFNKQTLLPNNSSNEYTI